MHAATLTTLSKIKQGQKILVVEQPNTTGFDFGRPKDTKAVFRSVTKLAHKPDDWTGKVYTVQITGGRRNEGRYGTTHVYIPAEAQEFASEVELDLAVTGTKRVHVDPDGTMHVEDWSGGTVIERTPKGRMVRIGEDGVLTIIEDFPEEDDAPTHKPAESEAEVASGERCHQCKGYGVVRKTGSKAGQHYRTAKGAEDSTVKGNSEKCPVCKGATLLVRAA